MRQVLQQLKPDVVGSRFDSWQRRVLTRPPVSPPACVAIIAGLVAVIGLADYASGTSISLQVFYLVPIALAVAWLGYFASFITLVSSVVVRVGGDHILGAEYTRRPSIVWNTVGFVATYMIVAWVLHSLIKLQRGLEERVKARTNALAYEISAREQLQQELIEISERERRTIGNDLHDGLGQHLTAMAYAAQVLSQQLAGRDDLTVKTAREIVRLAEEGIQQSRQLARGLLLTAIEPDSLNRELAELAATVQQQTGVRCQFESHRPPLVPDSSTASHIFRIAQEAVRNSIRDAQPTAVDVSLTGDEDALVLSINASGPGLPLTARKEAGVGLRIMQHRARLIGADFTLESRPGVGTRICCRVPLPVSTITSTAL
jgi:signal transduction histidine kinase